MSRRVAQGRRHQKAVLWSYVDNLNDQGEIRVSSTRVEIDVRWQEKQLEAFDQQGAPIATNYQAVVDRDVSVNSILWLGSLDDWSASETAYYRVATSQEVVDLLGRNPRRVLGLIRWRDTLPETV